MNNGNIKLSKTCWKCQSNVSPTFTFCCHCGNKLIKRIDLPLPDPKADTMFLTDLCNYGWHNRYVSAVSLYESIFLIDDIKKKHDGFSDTGKWQRILIAKIFCEYMGLLESTGMLLLSISRRKTTSLLWSYSNIEPSEVTQFYNTIKNTKHLQIEKLLKLPRMNVIEEAAATLGISDHYQSTLRDGYNNIATNIRLLADQYLNKKGLLVRNYNKLKHGFCLIEGNWIQPTLDSDKIAIFNYPDIGYLSPKQKDVDKQIQNIRNITLIGAELIATCLALEKINALYV